MHAHAGAQDEESEDGHAVLGQQRSTLCVSSQVGCQMGCTFCATGRRPLPCPVLQYPKSLSHLPCVHEQHAGRM
jgi:hypothetical protein